MLTQVPPGADLWVQERYRDEGGETWLRVLPNTAGYYPEYWGQGLWIEASVTEPTMQSIRADIHAFYHSERYVPPNSAPVGQKSGSRSERVTQLAALPSRAGLQWLRHLDLRGNPLKVLAALPADWEQVARWPRRLLQLDLSHNRFFDIPPALSLDLRGNIYPPDVSLVDFDHWYLSPPLSTEHSDLPFLEQCLE